jgi:hypothetical protein
VLASDINSGYQDTGNIQVLKVNGVRVVNLAHLAHLVSTCSDKFVRFDLEWNKVRGLAHRFDCVVAAVILLVSTRSLCNMLMPV